jgi:divalent metal cation (Fe/Co/Zn/Cd) transporter
VKEISQFVVRVFDLIEAEGRVLLEVGREEARRVHSAVNSMAVGATCLLISIPLFIAGISLLGIGLMWWLETQVTRPLAAVLTGFMFLAVASSLLLGFKLTRKPDRS